MTTAVAVGFLGAFTTFSTFAFETTAMLRADRAAAAFGYVALSLALGLGASALGFVVGRAGRQLTDGRRARRVASDELGAQALGGVLRGLAGVVSADVGEPVARPSHSGESYGSPQASTTSGRQRSLTTATRSGRSPTTATSVMPRLRRATAARALRERRRRLVDDGADELQDAVGVVGVAALAGQRGEAVQRDGGGRVGRRRGVVEQVLLAGDERLAVVGRREQAAVVDVPEVVEQRVGDGQRLVDPAGLAGGLGRAG